jgi:hypothetical protein
MSTHTELLFSKEKIKLGPMASFLGPNSKRAWVVVQLGVPVTLADIHENEINVRLQRPKYFSSSREEGQG